MQQNITTNHPMKWLIALMATVILSFGCSSGETKTDETKADSTPAATVAPAESAVAPTDSLPLDSASTRPEVRKN